MTLEQIKKEIETNFPINDTLQCDNCGNEVYIMNEIERYTNLIKSKGKSEFIKWFSNYEIEIGECGTCHYTLYMPYSHKSEMNTIKQFVLDLVNQLEESHETNTNSSL